jgi:MFS family permease
MAEAFSAAPNAELLSKLVLTAPAVAIALCAPFAGALVDRFGRVGILRASLVLYGAAGAAGYVLDDLYAILASRAALGVAVAGTMTSVTALVGDYYSGEARTRYAGLQSLAMSLGAVVCVAAGGLLADVGWRLPFLIYLTGWAVLVPVLLYVVEPRRSGVAPAGHGHGAAFPLGPIAAAYGITFFAVAMFYMIPVQIPFLLRAIGVDRARRGRALSWRRRSPCGRLRLRARGGGRRVRRYAHSGSWPQAALAGLAARVRHRRGRRGRRRQVAPSPTATLGRARAAALRGQGSRRLTAIFLAQFSRRSPSSARRTLAAVRSRRGGADGIWPRRRSGALRGARELWA